MPLDARAAPDDAERARALSEIGRTMLVEAGAGTGKTSVMAGRVVLLLADGVPPDAVVAITYTDFAAAELRDRIERFVAALLAGRPPVDMLPAFPNGQPTPQQAENLDRAARSLDMLNCMTIHGFCRMILTPYPAEADVDPGAAVLDKPQAKLLYGDVRKAWLRERLAQDETGDAFLSLFRASDRETLRILDDCAEHMRDNPGMCVPACANITAECAALRQAVAEFRGFLTRRCADCCPEIVACIVQAVEDQLASAPEPGNYAELAWAVALSVPECCRTGKGEFNHERTVCSKNLWKEAATGRSPKGVSDALQAEAVRFYHGLRDTHDALRMAACGCALHVISLESAVLLDGYAAAKRKAAALDFNDLIEGVRRLLCQRDDVRQALAARFRAVLVDEFQDTDRRQTEIFWRLCGAPPGNGDDTDWERWRLRPGTLFLVGDPKQSIYRFRGADLAAYKAAARLLEADPDAAIVRISRNFRSRPCILEAVNGWFAPVFTGLDGQAAFEALASDLQDCIETGGVAVLDFDPEAEPERPMRDIEAELVAGACRAMIGNLIIRRADGTTGPCEPGDIALLAPVGRELWRYERALEDERLPVTAQAGKGFFRRQEVQDLIALARTLADSRDRLAFGALLRGPLVGATDEALLDAVEAQAERADGTRHLHLGMNAARISDAVLRSAVERLQALTRERRTKTPHMLLAHAVDALCVRPILRQRGRGVAERALANVDLFLEMARPFDLRGLKAFADSMRSHWEEARSELDARPDIGRQSISLMTMHAAKGLEWPVVILVNTAGKCPPAPDIGMDRAGGLFRMKAFGRHPEGCKAALDEEERQRKLERQRLWWVAATRARDLLLLPSPKQRLSAPAWIEAVTLPLDALPHFNTSEFVTVDAPVVSTAVNAQDGAAFASEADRIRAAIPRIRRIRPSRHEVGEGGAFPDSPEAPLAGMSADPGGADILLGDPPEAVVGAGAARGRVLHKLIEEVLLGILPEAAAPLAARASLLLDQLGIPQDRRPDAAELASCVTRGLSCAEVAAVRAALRPEWPLATSTPCLDGSEDILLGVADAIAADSDGAVSLVVDWKSDVAPDAATAAAYRNQIRRYIEAARATRGIVVYVSTGRVDEVVLGR